MYFQDYSDLVKICVVKNIVWKNLQINHFYLYGLCYDLWLLCFEVAQFFFSYFAPRGKYQICAAVDFALLLLPPKWPKPDPKDLDKLD